MSKENRKQIHWIDKNGQQPTDHIIHGVFECYSSSSHPTGSAINYLASSQAKQHKHYDHLFQGQGHSIHGRIVPRHFELYLPMDEDGNFLTLQARGHWK
eukprot:14282409-Ditylum_brightwellii.AAC.1